MNWILIVNTATILNQHHLYDHALLNFWNNIFIFLWDRHSVTKTKTIIVWGDTEHKKVKVTLNNYRASKVNTNVNPTETTKRNKKKLNHTHIQQNILHA